LNTNAKNRVVLNSSLHLLSRWGLYTSYTVGGNANCPSHSGGSSNLKTGLPYNPATALLGIHPKNTKLQIQRGTCTQMSTPLSITQTMERAQTSIN